MGGLRIRESQRWRDTQLNYDARVARYGKYTHAVIRADHREVVDICERHARTLPHALTIVDVGCGWTDFYDKLEHVTGIYVGVEPSEIELLRAPTREKQYLFRGVGEELPLSDACSDIVLHVADLDHCYDAEKAIQESFRVTKPGGKIIIVLENRGRFSNDIRRFLGWEISHGEEHLYYFSVNDILSLVKPYGHVDFFSSHGFLLGFDLLGEVLPETIVSGMQMVSDKILARLVRKKGQHFIVSVTKTSEGSFAPIGFICPRCRKLFEWQTKRCTACGREFRWIRPDVLDTIDEMMV